MMPNFACCRSSRMDSFLRMCFFLLVQTQMVSAILRFSKYSLLILLLLLVLFLLLLLLSCYCHYDDGDDSLEE